MDVKTMEKDMLHFSPGQSALMAAIAAVQAEVGVIEKSADNPYFKSKYAPLDAIWSKATRACLNHGLVVIQPATGHGVWTYVMHTPSGEWMASYMELPLTAPVGKDKTPGPVTPQVVGSVTSYARRYGYLSALGLVAGEEDDDGNAGSFAESPASVKKGAGKVAPVKASPTERKLLAYDRIRLTCGESEGDKNLRELLGDLLGRPMDDLTLKDMDELKTVEEYAANLNVKE